MKPLSENQKEHIQAAALERFLRDNGAFNDFKEAMKNLEPERFDKHFFVQEERAFLNTFIEISAAFPWTDAQENGWGEATQWRSLHSEFDSYFKKEYRKIKSFLNETIVGYDLQRFFEGQDIGIDLFIAEVVRQKSIDKFEEQVNKNTLSNPIMNGFSWCDAINIGTGWLHLNDLYSSFYESKSEVAAL